MGLEKIQKTDKNQDLSVSEAIKVLDEIREATRNPEYRQADLFHKIKIQKSIIESVKYENNCKKLYPYRRGLLARSENYLRLY